MVVFPGALEAELVFVEVVALRNLEEEFDQLPLELVPALEWAQRILVEVLFLPKKLFLTSNLAIHYARKQVTNRALVEFFLPYVRIIMK